MQRRVSFLGEPEQRQKCVLIPHTPVQLHCCECVCHTESPHTHFCPTVMAAPCLLDQQRVTSDAETFLCGGAAINKPPGGADATSLRADLTLDLPLSAGQCHNNRQSRDPFLDNITKRLTDTRRCLRVRHYADIYSHWFGGGGFTVLNIISQPGATVERL